MSAFVHKYLGKYGHLICKQAEYKLEAIQWERFKEVCLHGKQSAGGLDGFEPADFALLSDLAYQWIVRLLNTIEDGGSWPVDLTNAKAAYLAKDPNRLEDPLAYRVLMILPTVYRRWASTRLGDMDQWVRSWQKPTMFAGVPDAGAEDAWWTTALDLEEAHLNGTAFSGGATDIWKCFDQLNRQLLYELAKRAGMPVRVLRAYIAFQESLRIHNSVAGGLGKPFSRKCGIPQGCPLSMMLTA